MARRKRASSATESEGEDINLTPMLDVVFILLIFFIVTAQFIKEPGVDIMRTDVDNDQQVKPLAILVAIDEHAEIYLDKRLVQPNEIEFRLRELREDNPKGELVLQIDNKASAESLVEFMDTVKNIDGSTRINVSTAPD